MTVSSIASSSVAIAQQALRSPAESGEVGKDHDGDQDDGGSKISATAPTLSKPSINTVGQIVGTTVHTTA